MTYFKSCFFFQAEDGIRDGHVTGVQTCALPILKPILYVANVSEDGLADAETNPYVQKVRDYATAEGAETRSEERRVGKECRYRGAADDEKKKKREIDKETGYRRSGHKTADAE